MRLFSSNLIITPRVGSGVLQNKPTSFRGRVAECRKRRLDQGSFVLLYFTLFAFSELYSVCVFCEFLISFVYFRVFSTAYIVNGTV